MAAALEEIRQQIADAMKRGLKPWKEEYAENVENARALCCGLASCSAKKGEGMQGLLTKSPLQRHLNSTWVDDLEYKRCNYSRYK